VAAHSLLSWPTLSVGATGFLLGCRHGLDWDHLAAITDLTTANRSSHAKEHRRGVSLAFWYCIGHGLVIAALGAVVGVLGLDLPAGIDRIFEAVVGATLVALGAFVLWQLGRDRGEYRYAGRIKILIGVVRRAWSRARRRGAEPADALDDLGPRSAFAVGVLHGTGAETPTQVVLFASAGAAGSTEGAMFILLAFVSGLVISDLGIAAAWLTGFVGLRRSIKAQLVLGGLTGVTSLAVGGLFLAGRAAVLPALFGG
jgi:high-affinity nickel-transport protein